jgi:hypothetical protein
VLWEGCWLGGREGCFGKGAGSGGRLGGLEGCFPPGFAVGPERYIDVKMLSS